MPGRAGRTRSGLAPDVDLVCLEDEIGAALSVAHECSEERRAEISDSVHVLHHVRWCHPAQQVIYPACDERMFPGEAGYGTGQSWRGIKEVAIQAVGTLRDVNVAPEVAGEFHERNLDSLHPACLICDRWCGQRVFQGAHRLAQL